ncbi:hypothetical protein [Nostoc sp.]|uniref:hypothetical protein n=1 Tax=Nostoc sp. TaxID=1180 RepID=UPI002FF01490
MSNRIDAVCQLASKLISSTRSLAIAYGGRSRATPPKGKRWLAAMFGFVDPLEARISVRCATLHISLSTPSSATLQLLDFTI